MLYYNTKVTWNKFKIFGYLVEIEVILTLKDLLHKLIIYGVINGFTSQGKKVGEVGENSETE